jgi:hypothetical protein
MQRDLQMIDVAELGGRDVFSGDRVEAAWR